jgi:hypothetical protein
MQHAALVQDRPRSAPAKVRTSQGQHQLGQRQLGQRQLAQQAGQQQREGPDREPGPDGIQALPSIDQRPPVTRCQGHRPGQPWGAEDTGQASHRCRGREPGQPRTPGTRPANLWGDRKREPGRPFPSAYLRREGLSARICARKDCRPGFAQRKGVSQICAEKGLSVRLCAEIGVGPALR